MKKLASGLLCMCALMTLWGCESTQEAPPAAVLQDDPEAKTGFAGDHATAYVQVNGGDVQLYNLRQGEEPTFYSWTDLTEFRAVVASSSGTSYFVSAKLHPDSTEKLTCKLSLEQVTYQASTGDVTKWHPVLQVTNGYAYFSGSWPIVRTTSAFGGAEGTEMGVRDYQPPGTSPRVEEIHLIVGSPVRVSFDNMLECDPPGDVNDRCIQHPYKRVAVRHNGNIKELAEPYETPQVWIDAFRALAEEALN